nr:MAPEG family protein [Gloeobacter violaceus]
MSALDTLVWPGLVTVAALVVYYGLSLNVGRARVRYGVAPPETNGNPDFERVLRVQENTTEQLVLFLPSLWLYALFVNPLWAAVLGSVWVVGRVLYALGYYEASERRTPGFAVSVVATLILLGGALVGLLRRLVLP